jgi:hypothetical protein
MRAFRGVLVALAALSGGCGGGDGDGSFTSASQATETLAGTWRATKAEFINRSNSSQRVDLVAQGSVVVLVLEAGGSFRLTITDPGQAGNVLAGTWSASRDVLTIRQTGQTGESQFDMSLSVSTLSLNNGHILFDIDDDGAGDECLLNMTLTRE